MLDTGALIAFERGERRVAALIEATRRRGDRVATSSGCVAQAWRDGARQVLLARLLPGVVEHPLHPGDSRTVGELLAASRTADVVDAHLVLLAHDRDSIVTSDPEDVRTLLSTTAMTSPRLVICD